MCTRILYLSVFLLYISSSYGRFRNDYIFYKEAEGWLKVHEIPANFYNAFQTCDFEGAVLASPSTYALKNALISVYPKSSNCGMYTGIHSTISHGDYTTIEGTPLARIPVAWAPNEPDNYEDKENCLIMLQSGSLADVMCNETFPYACYKKKTKSLVITECGTTDIEYNLDKWTGSCYKFHLVGLSWRRAQKACLAEGGHLAIINSIVEANVIAKLFSYFKASMMSAQHKETASSGFLYWKADGRWYTIHGQQLEKSGYSVWSDGFRGSLQMLCGGVSERGKLVNVPCNITRPFICEKAPESLVEDDDMKSTDLKIKSM